MTDYIILKREDGCTDFGAGSEDVWWQPNPEIVKASSAGRAIAASLDIGGGAGDYVAVPMRSWKPLTVKVEQTTKVTIG